MAEKNQTRGKQQNYHPLLENRNFSGTEPPLDLRPVRKLEFVRCGPVEKTRALCLSRFNFFRIAKILRGRVLKPGDSFFGF